MMSINRLTRGNLQFLLGLALGLTIAFLLMSYMQLKHNAGQSQKGSQPLKVDLQHPHARDLGDHDLDPHETIAGIHHSDDGDTKAVKFEDLHEHHDDDAVAKELSNRVRVLVWVMTGPQNLDKRAVHVRNTWGRRVNKLLFMSSKWNASFPTVGLDVPEGRKHLTAKTMKAFRYVYENHMDDADWFMKADDDTYVVLENLRYMLSAYDTNDPVFFGKVFKMAVKQGYTSGGAGYVLSKEALRRLAMKGNSVCRKDGGAEDAEMGICLSKLGVKLLPSTDRLGRSRFHCFGPESHLQGGFPQWFLKYDMLGGKGDSIDNISDYAVVFQKILPKFMYAMEYFLYHQRPYGIISRSQSLNPSTPRALLDKN